MNQHVFSGVGGFSTSTPVRAQLRETTTFHLTGATPPDTTCVFVDKKGGAAPSCRRKSPIAADARVCCGGEETRKDHLTKRDMNFRGLLTHWFRFNGGINVFLRPALCGLKLGSQRAFFCQKSSEQLVDQICVPLQISSWLVDQHEHTRPTHPIAHPHYQVYQHTPSTNLHDADDESQVFPLKKIAAKLVTHVLLSCFFLFFFVGRSVNSITDIRNALFSCHLKCY